MLKLADPISSRPRRRRLPPPLLLLLLLLLPFLAFSPFLYTKIARTPHPALEGSQPGGILRRGLVQLSLLPPDRGPPVELGCSGNFVPLYDALEASFPRAAVENLTVAGFKKALGVYAADRTELDLHESLRGPTLQHSLEAAAAALSPSLSAQKKGAKRDPGTEAVVAAQAGASRGPHPVHLGMNASIPGHLPLLYPHDSVRMLIAIMSTCCGQGPRMKRDAIRSTWMSAVASDYPNVHVRFILGQPVGGRGAVDPIELEVLASEARQYGDLVWVRGPERYESLTQKTLGALRYALSSPSLYTHMLKTDDDCYVRPHRLFEALAGPTGGEDGGPTRIRRRQVYMGCIENRAGFMPIRSPQSKWYLSKDELPDEDVPWNVKYLAGWGYVLSRDVIEYALTKAEQYERSAGGGEWQAGGPAPGGPAPSRPRWWKRYDHGLLQWEDVTMGLLVKDYVEPQDASTYFRTPWRMCTNATAVKHLDVDAPGLFRGLYEQDRSGLWDRKSVQCSSGDFWAGDYHLWRRWRNTVAKPI